MPKAPGHLPMRRACARCHAHKLACPGRIDEERKCARCVRANAACVFGASVRGMRPATIAAAGLKTASEMDQDVVAAPSSDKSTRKASKDKPSPAGTATLQSTPGPEPDPLSIEPFAFEELMDSNFSPEDSFLHTDQRLHNEAAHIELVETLTKLNLDLLRHIATIPPTASSPSRGDFQGQTAYHLDQAFHLTSVMLHTIQRIHIPGTLCLTAADAVTIDTASIHLVISCWHRFVEIYESLFIHIRRCVEESILPVASGGSISLPAVRIGTYTPPSTTSILLQIVATLHHSTLLAHAMAELATNLIDQTGFITAIAGTNDQTYEGIQIQAVGFHTQVKSIKSTLSHAGLF
ncbi:hypothetical protein B0I35DRAFT_510169 [Stachybotrys elegans]|uniref:Zn(2)-C6 fungal-type domain-containing protein n=1 Tax=Stachybotrys elegans TaxID=80388 RepID=A0A8K0T097_9HYPO|nr:hypothetical protein B0I35DRAFT_510169 [Stachybotrys elegans]